MPLHDWSNLKGWEGVHDIWLVELLRCIKPQLPPGYRAHLGSAPVLTVDTSSGKPDVAVRNWVTNNGHHADVAAEEIEPDEEVATLALDVERSIHVTFEGRLAAAVEIISPRNKDRPSSRTASVGRYLGYLQSDANLMIVDVHQLPAGFSFADLLATELQLQHLPLPSPMAAAYRVGGPAPDGGSFVASWRRQLAVGQKLPRLPLPLSTTRQVQVDLEDTYSRAAADAYLT